LPDLFSRPPFSLTVAPSSSSKPRFWVERFCIWSEPDKLVREITLKPGLNIIWSPDAAKDEEAIGHGAGKTTFCRLLRFCLGEASFGSKDQRAHITGQFPTGQVSAEVWLDGEQWTIVRPFNRYHRDKITRQVPSEETTADPTALQIEAFTDAVQKAFFGDLTGLLPSKIRPTEVWSSALAWLSRDQECRFDRPLAWRHSSTESLSPVIDLSTDERAQTARTFLRCITQDEYDMSKAAEDSNVPTEGDELQRVEWAISRIQIGLAEALGGDIGSGIGDLDFQLLETRIRERFPGLSRIEQENQKRDRRKAVSALESASLERSRLEGELDTTSATETGKSALLMQRRAEVANFSSASVIAESPACPVCDIPLNRILENGCPYSVEEGYLDAVRERHALAGADVQRLTLEVKELVELAKVLRSKTSNARDIEEAARRALRELEEVEDQQNATHFRGERFLDRLNELTVLRDERSALLARVSELAQDRGERSKTLQKLRKDSRPAIKDLSIRFDQVIRQLVSGEVSGSIELEDGVLQPHVQAGGDCSTAAIESLKVVAFDLATLTLSCEGNSLLPAWLLHDSPREADLGESLYWGQFYFATRLERQANFQYIVTTTTPPPLDLQDTDWVRAKLKAAPASERLMKCNL
jgi:hypothetical protein